MRGAFTSGIYSASRRKDAVAHERERVTGIDRDVGSREKLERAGSVGASAIHRQILTLHGAIGNAAVGKLMRLEWPSAVDMSETWSADSEKWAPASEKWAPASEKWAPASEKWAPASE